MENRKPYIRNQLSVVLLLILFWGSSCRTINITKYYHRHQPTLDSIEQTYKSAFVQKPFSIEFTDRPFDQVSLELMTDSLTYIYEFRVGEDRMQDTLQKYGYQPPVVNGLIRRMKSINCTWINNLDYYAEDRRQSMIYISLWPKTFNSPFSNKKYYILTYFQTAQYFDNRGYLLTGRRRKRLRKINAEVFRRISDRVCYTLSDKFR